jgi:dienelactone hydrolase
VSIHGSLATGKPAEAGTVVAKVLVCHGASDPHVPMDDVAAFTDEMNRADADWQLVIYGRAMHGFTHKHAVSGAMPGVAYQAQADERSFAATRAFLAEALTNR